MARKLRLFIPDIPCHIVQRGNNQTQVFHAPEDYQFFLRILQEARQKHLCQIYGFCLMPNHFHLIINPKPTGNASLFMELTGEKYVRYFNKRYSRTDRLWEDRFHSFLIGTKHYFIRCLRYIETNPIRSNLVKIPESYPWSSYNCRAFGINSHLIDCDPWFRGLGDTISECRRIYAQFVKKTIEDEELNQLRSITQKGGIFANEQFKNRIRQYSKENTAIKHPVGLNRSLPDRQSNLII